MENGVNGVIGRCAVRHVVRALKLENVFVTVRHQCIMEDHVTVKIMNMKNVKSDLAVTMACLNH